jgi:hypothetical protein
MNLCSVLAAIANKYLAIYNLLLKSAHIITFPDPINQRSQLNEFKPAGSYDVDFNSANLSSGVYFYSLTVPDHSQKPGNLF